MRIHSNTIELADVYRAVRTAGAHSKVSVHGSRSHKRAFNVKLTGNSRRRPNGGDRGAGDDYAATWDQWGVFFSYLFDADPEMVAGSVGRPVYADVYDFDRRTNGRFAVLDMDGARVPNHGSRGMTYWPSDAHGDHKFEFEGIRYDNAIIRRCTKCTAVQIHPR